jgi:8-oxo-dGTP diphosphatase
MRTKLVVKAAILNEEGHVLLLQRSPTDANRPGEWDFPGGGIEDGEDLLAAGAREIQEEAGLSISPETLKLVYTTTQLKDDENIVRLLLVGRINGDNEVRLSFEHDAFRWLPIDEALTAFPHPVWGVGLGYARDNQLLPAS